MVMTGLKALTPRNIETFIAQQLIMPEKPGLVDALSGPVRTTDQLSETYYDVGMVPPVTEIVGARTEQQVREIGPWTVTCKLMGVGMRVTREELTLDKTGRVAERVDDLVGRWKQNWHRELMIALKLGESTACYDAQSFFDTDHAEGKSGTQSNDITSTAAVPATPTAAEYQTAIFKSITTLHTVKDDQGEPSWRRPMSFALFIPPAHIEAVAGALKSAAIPGGAGASNALVSYGQFEFEIVSDPYLATTIGGAAWTTKFALVARSGRAFMRQDQKGWQQLVEAKKDGSDYAYDTFGFAFGISGKRVLTYGDWKEAVLCTFTT